MAAELSSRVLPPVTPPRDIESIRQGLASKLIADQLSLTPASALELIFFGGVYLNRRRLRDDCLLRPGDWVRVHLSPRRFWTDRVSWRDRLIDEHEAYVVIDKPAGIPVHPTCDNAVENVLVQMERCLGMTLFICHRLDIATQGLLMLAKSPEFRADFGRSLEARQVVKRYRALVEKAVSEGELRHYMQPANRAPRTVTRTPSQGAKECLLTIERASALPRLTAYELSLTLHTGRNHQIRAQLSAEAVPILGDVLYGSMRSAPPGVGDGIALQCDELHFNLSGVTKASYTLPPPW